MTIQEDASKRLCFDDISEKTEEKSDINDRESTSEITDQDISYVKNLYQG